jgi:3-deoxy-D-manno-octulosonic-acid transferase
MFSAIFRPTHRYFQWYGGMFRRALQSCQHIFVQNRESVELLHSIGVEQVSLAGDTRFDRVSDVAANANRIPMVEAFLKEDWTLIAGSSWPRDEAWLERLWQQSPPDWKLILAPHEVHDAHIEAIEARFPNAIRYSKLSLGHEGDERVLIIDNIGMLTQLYQYGHLALIGGGFGKGIHNVLEAAVFGMPVMFGPQHTTFQEALGLLESGGGLALHNPQEIPEQALTWLQDPHARAEAGRKAREFVRSGTGATVQIRATLAEA